MNNELAACPGGQFKYLIEEFLDELERRVRHIAERDVEAGRSGDHGATVELAETPEEWENPIVEIRR